MAPAVKGFLSWVLKLRGGVVEDVSGWASGFAKAYWVAKKCWVFRIFGMQKKLFKEIY